MIYLRANLTTICDEEDE